MPLLWRLIAFFIAISVVGFAPVDGVSFTIASVDPAQFLSFDAQLGIAITGRVYKYGFTNCPTGYFPISHVSLPDENITAGMVYFNPSDPDVDMGQSKFPLLLNNLPQHGDALLKLTFRNPFIKLGPLHLVTYHPNWQFAAPDAYWTLNILFRPRFQTPTSAALVSEKGGMAVKPPVAEEVDDGRVCHFSSVAAFENCAHQFRRVAVWLEVPKSSAEPAMIFNDIAATPQPACINDEQQRWGERWETTSQGAYKCSSSVVTLVAKTEMKTGNNESVELETQVKFSNLRVMPFGEQAAFPLLPFFDKCHRDSWDIAIRRYKSTVLIHGRTGLATLYAHLLHLLLAALAVTTAVLLIRAHLRQKRLREEYERETQSMVTGEEFDDVDMDDVDVLMVVTGGKRGGKGQWMKAAKLGAGSSGIKYDAAQGSGKVA